jgi:glycosyltransferase involved in cell wall biosynthesis
VRAAFVTPALGVGGLERQWSVLIPGLVHRGVTAEVFTLDGRGRFFDELAAKEVAVRCLDLHGRLNVVGARNAARTIAAGNPDLVFSAGVSAHVVGQLASRRAQAKHVAAIHAVPEHPDTFTFRRRLIVRALAPHVAASTAVTSAQLPFLRALRFDPANTHVIPNGVERVETRRSRELVREELGVHAKAFVVLLVATLRPEKRVDRFVEIVTAANRAHGDIRGLIAGGGPELDRARRLCAASGSTVTALGPRSDTPELIRAADAICLTSDAEALPLVVLEAMAGGRAVIATDVGGVRDAVVDGKTGYVVDPRDRAAFVARLTELASNQGLAAAFGEAGRHRHEALFTLARMVDAHHDLFRRLTAAEAAERQVRAHGRTA